MAVENAAFYRFNRWVSLNEMGAAIRNGPVTPQRVYQRDL
jgi:maltooligosyltrehalose synthase